MTLFHGDCLEKLKEVETGSVDMVLADLPYGTTACKWDNVIPFAALWELLHRVCKSTAVMVMFGSEPFSSAMRVSNLKEFKYDWIWDKRFAGNFAAAKYQPLKRHELISIFYKKANYRPQMEQRDVPIKSGKRANPKHFSSSGEQTIWTEAKKEYLQKYPTSILSFPRKLGEKLEHPTQKPVALLEYLIKTYTNEGDTVLDPTMGSGSTGVACKNLNRKFVGIEKEPQYFEIAQKRIFNTFPEFVKQTFPDATAAGAAAKQKE